MRRIGLLVGLALACASSPARAQDALEAQFFDRWARDLYARGEAQDALRTFLLAHRAAPTDKSLYNIALVAEIANEPLLAYSFFEAYLASDDGDPERRGHAKRHAEQLGAQFGRLEVVTQPPGAEIYVDREALGARGRTPRILALPPGEHTLMLTLEGYEPARRRVTAARGDTVSMQVTLRRRTGELLVTTDPPGGQVQVRRSEGDLAAAPRADVYTRTATAGAPLELPIGSYTLRFFTEDGREASSEVRILADRLERRHLAASANTPARGTVLVNGRARELWIDGARRAQTPARIRLPPGPHQLEVRAETKRWRSEIIVYADEVLLVNPKL